jgi:putative hydrolase of the HAD superfamily
MKPSTGDSPSVTEPTTKTLGAVDAVLFDLYGTLLRISVDEDSPALWTGLAAALVGAGAAIAPDRVRSEFQSILHDEGKRRREGFVMEFVFRRLLASAAVGDNVARLGMVFRELSLKELTLLPYVVPLFDALRRSGCTTAIVSNTEAVLTRFDFRRFPLLRTVDTIVLSSEVGVKKPDPRIFRIALERLRATSASTVFIGNSLTEDIAGARSIGLRCVYLEEGLHDTEPTVSADGAVIRVPPTLRATTQALRRFGWTGVA